MRMMRKGTAVAAVSVFLVCVLLPFPGGETEGAQASAVVTIPDYGFHPGRDEAFAFFRDVRKLGDYVGDTPTEFMHWEPEVQEVYVQALVHEFAAERYEKPQASEDELKSVLDNLCQEGTNFAQAEMRYAIDKGPMTQSLAGMRFSGHVSLQFVWNMCTGQPRAGTKPVDPKSQAMATRG